jgi:hypothetical protein
MTAKHTPGLWACDDTGVKDAEGFSICSTGNNRAIVGNERAANLRLIAAAPDLLAALQALEWAVSGVDYIETEYADQVAQARAAIAKATTEE